jgi:hypothetical protein
VPHLARCDELTHGTRDLFDREVRIHPMLVEQVDDVRAEPAQRRLRDAADLLRTAVETHHRAVTDVPAELRRDHYPVADRLQSLAYELLVDVGAVDLGGVEQGDALVDGVPQHRVMSSRSPGLGP